uniref:F-box associated domain-containing protein n=1 Tax=Oryza meridionalis TaxID=40149 RepID=A0A0E0D7L4_9ORYZ
MSGGAESSGDSLMVSREASRQRRRRERAAAVERFVGVPLADVVRENALVHLPPAAAARLRVVHPSWASHMSSPIFAVAHAAAPRRVSGVFVPLAGFLPFDGDDDAVPSPSLSFVPASSELVVLSSSRGVACCFSPADDAYAVCNPATASWTAVPPPPCRSWPRPAIVVLFDTSAYNFRGDFTLVCPFESEPGSSGAYCFQVFTSGTGAWCVTDAMAPAEGLVAASGVAAGATAWWRTSIGTAVGYTPVTGRVDLVTCPGDSDQWEIGSAAGMLHCAVIDGGDAVVFRLHDHGIWEVTTRLAVAEILQPSQPPPARAMTSTEIVASQQPAPAHEHDESGAEEEEEGSRAVVAAANAPLRLDDGVRLLGFQGAEVEVVVLAGRRLVAFDARTRRRREVAVPDEVDATWDGAEHAAHINTLALIAPAALAAEPPLAEQAG